MSEKVTSSSKLAEVSCGQGRKVSVMIVTSHKDGFVAKVLYDSGAKVKAGNEILDLDTNEEDLRIARLSALEQLRVVLQERLSDPVVKINRQVAQMAVDTAKSILQLNRDSYVQMLNLYGLGNTVPPATLAAAYPNTFPESYEQAQLQLQQFEMQVTESKGINDLVKDHIAEELKTASARKGLAAIKAPIDGQLKIDMVSGAFVKKHQLLFEID